MFNNLMRKIKPVRVVEEAAARHRQYALTPDLWYLNQHSRQLIFIADDLKVGKMKHDLIEGHLPIHPSCYTHDSYTVYNKDLGTHSFPLPFEKEVDFGTFGWYKPELARIRGELYALPSHYFWKVLDIQKQNGVQFTRKRVSITLPWREVKYNPDPDAKVWVSKIPTISRDHIRTIRAWMYVANPEYWDNYIGVSLGTRAVPIREHNSPKIWIDHFYEF